MQLGRYVYFLFSSEQRKLRADIEKSIGKKYLPGKVLNNGKWKEYTEMSSNNKSRFSDSIIVAEGYINELRYVSPSSI